MSQDYLHDLIAQDKPYGDIGYSLKIVQSGHYIGKDGLTHLELAASHDNLPVSLLLLTKGAKFTEDVREYFNKKLCAAIWEGRTADSITLINAGADVNYVDIYGWSPLHLAVRKADIILAEILINAGADLTKISSNHESKTPSDIMTDKALKVGLASLASKDSSKSTLFLYQGPDIYVDSMTYDPMRNLLHSDLLGKYFKLLGFCEFRKLLAAIESHAVADSSINVLFNAHGTKEPGGFKITVDRTQQPPVPSFVSPALTISGFGDPKLTPDELCNSIVKAAGNAKLHLLFTACYGANIHDDLATVKANAGSVITTLSNHDSVTTNADSTNPNTIAILEVLRLRNPDCNLKLEDWLVAYCFSQRFLYNQPTISIFGKDGVSQKINLEEYFATQLLSKPLKLSPIIEYLFAMKGLSATDMQALVRDPEYDDIRTNKFRVPASLIGFDIDGHSPESLLAIYKTYFIPGDLAGFKWSSKADRVEDTHNVTPIILNGFHRIEYEPPSESDIVNYAVPYHSVFLTMAADYVLQELGHAQMMGSDTHD